MSHDLDLLIPATRKNKKSYSLDPLEAMLPCISRLQELNFEQSTILDFRPDLVFISRKWFINQQLIASYYLYSCMLSKSCQ